MDSYSKYIVSIYDYDQTARIVLDILFYCMCKFCRGFLYIGVSLTKDVIYVTWSLFLGIACHDIYQYEMHSQSFIVSLLFVS